MDKDKLAKLLMATFLEELGEHVRALNRDLLALEQKPSAADRVELWKELFRSAHSLKGAARAVNVELIERVCHHLEEILTSARDGQLTLTPVLFSLLFETADALENAGGRLREGQRLDDSPIAALLPRLEAAQLTDETPAGQQTTGEIRGQKSEVSQRRVARPESSKGVESGFELLPRPSKTQGVPLQPTEPQSPAPAAPLRAAMSRAASASNTVRVPAEKLDTLLAQSGELLVARRRVAARDEVLVGLRESIGEWRAEWKGVEKPLHDFLLAHERGESLEALPTRAAQTLARAGDRIRQLERDLERLTTEAVSDGRQLDYAAGSLDAEVRRVRMLPFAEACQGLDRAVHDLARATGKEVELVITGGEVELDRSVLEGLKDPLLHLVRNAVDHGAELPATRLERGKSPCARIVVSAALRGHQVEIVVSDDGQGIDLAALREQVRRKGLPEPVDDRELTRVIFQPGFSTARIITDVSGRGVGLDVVQNRVEALRGLVDPISQPGQGTSFVLTVPLTLTTLQVLLLTVGDQTFAMASSHIRRLVRVRHADIRTVQGREVLLLGDAPVPVASLADTLQLPHGEIAPENHVPGLLLTVGDRQVVLLVDEVLSEQEVVIKGLGARIRRVRAVSGATLLPSGRIALLLNMANVVRTAHGRRSSTLMAATAGSDAPSRRRLLVAEDSMTTRALMKSILEAAGYDVTVAPDGQAAWQLLQERGADLLVSDVDMPRMDGFDLAATVRASSKFAKLPVILVTARQTDADKTRGISVGADAYLVKSAFDQRHLLETISQLL